MSAHPATIAAVSLVSMAFLLFYLVILGALGPEARSGGRIALSRRSGRGYTGVSALGLQTPLPTVALACPGAAYGNERVGMRPSGPYERSKAARVATRGPELRAHPCPCIVTSQSADRPGQSTSEEHRTRSRFRASLPNGASRVR
jgi:hypothetical protein